LTLLDIRPARAGGDYSPGQHLQTLAEYRKAKPVVRGQHHHGRGTSLMRRHKI